MNNYNLTEMLAQRQATEKADKYILCFIEKGLAYAIITDSIRKESLRITTTATAKGKQLSERIAFATLYRNALKTRKSCICLGDFNLLNNAYKAYYEKVRGKKAPNNKGLAFEYTIFHLHGQEWKPNNVPYWVDGDITINGISYQIKAEGAEYFTASSLASALKAGA